MQGVQGVTQGVTRGTGGTGGYKGLQGTHGVVYLLALSSAPPWPELRLEADCSRLRPGLCLAAARGSESVSRMK